MVATRVVLMGCGTAELTAPLKAVLWDASKEHWTVVPKDIHLAGWLVVMREAWMADSMVRGTVGR